MIWVSWSLLRMHRECRQKSYLHRTKQRSEKVDVRRYFHGTVGDRLMRTYLERGGDFDMEAEVYAQMERTTKETINERQGSLRWRPGQKEKAYEKVLTGVQRLKPLLDEHVLPYEYQPEAEFKVPYLVPPMVPGGDPIQVLLVGAIDIVVHYGDGRFSGLDLKMTTDSSYYRKTWGQGVLYSIAFEALMEGKASFEEFYFVQPLLSDKHKMRPLALTEQAELEMVHQISQYAHDVKIGRVEPKQGTDGCSYCAGRPFCEKFKFEPINGHPLTVEDLDDLLK